MLKISMEGSLETQTLNVCFLKNIKFRQSMNTLDYIINFSLPPGDPHQFEQKFNYRRPMYPILKYMWDKDNYRESIKVTEHEPQHFKSYMLV